MITELIGQYDMLPPGSKVLCAVSGGADSMCLLSLLWSKRTELSISVAAAHYEHGLRGEESLRDAEFVSAFCRERGIECVVEHGDVALYAKEHSIGLEEAGRELRYAFLEKAADALGCDRIATAHNADDNAETLLFNLCRGTGIAGLGAVAPIRGRLIRPLLTTTRAEIMRYLGENNIPHVEDSTNAADDYTRNLLRHRVMPVLREVNPRFAEAAFRLSELARQDEDCLSALAKEFISEKFNGESMAQTDLAALHPAVAARVIRALCPKKLSETNVREALALCGGSELKYAVLPGITLRRELGRIYFGNNEYIEIEPQELIPGKQLFIPGAGLVIRSKVTDYSEEINGLFKTYLFKYDSICGKISVTRRRSGDKLRPAGRGCTKTLKSLFLEAGYTQRQRDTALVLRDELGILGVLGLAVDERAVPKPGDRVLMLQTEKY